MAEPASVSVLELCLVECGKVSLLQAPRLLVSLPPQLNICKRFVHLGKVLRAVGLTLFLSALSLQFLSQLSYFCLQRVCKRRLNLWVYIIAVEWICKVLVLRLHNF